jgi:hypothetical protein
MLLWVRGMACVPVTTAYLTAIAALAGSVIGGLTSFATAWLTQNRQAVAQERAREKVRRQKLYRQFIEEALIIDT